eukprot:TRINITY_DN66717_c0_g1_i1.p1 TRINITY_DN66717_c0_g1~~TRINITY_DN66717_c0_g1_i1.p1  ORF type:complete len:291 (-),score=35.05 TRINITY_DN66717_c0_g1_i1:47-919(-)
MAGMQRFLSVTHKHLCWAGTCRFATSTQRDVFRCPGIEDAALQMRRRVQVAIFVEFFGSQFAKSFGRHFDFTNFLSVSEHAMANSTLVTVLHVGAMWWYQSYTRDHLMARHVTRIWLESPGPRPLENGVPLVVHVETGPWSRRLELRSRGVHIKTVPLGRLAQVGAIHIDRERGEILDNEALELVLSNTLHPVSEELHTDEDLKHDVGIGSYDVMPLLIEDTTGVYKWMADLPPLLQRPLLWRGSSVFRNFGFASLAMGFGSVLIWLPKGSIPMPPFLEQALAPKPSFKY